MLGRKTGVPKLPCFVCFFVTVADIDECANKPDKILQLASASTPKAHIPLLSWICRRWHLRKMFIRTEIPQIVF